MDSITRYITVYMYKQNKKVYKIYKITLAHQFY